MAAFKPTFVIFVLLLTSATACRCILPTIEKSYYPPSTISFISAKVKKITLTSRSKIYTLRVIFDYKGCLQRNDRIKLTTSTSSASCGLELEKRKRYVLPVRKDGQINSCDFVRTTKELTKQERRFLTKRQIVCKGVTTCANGQRPAGCKRLSCEFLTPPCEGVASCIDNFCQGCGTIEWFDKEGMLTCV